MITTDNTSFPRGGRKVQIVKAPKRKHEENLFHEGSKVKSKKVKKDSPVSEKNEDWQLSLKLQGTLNYNKMEDGMIVLSCVRCISNLIIQVEFPGLTHGIVAINQISDDFNKVLSKVLKSGNDGSYDISLRKIVSVGQLMPAKIVSVEKTDKGHEVQATINPGDVNADKKHYSFKKGETIWANVVSELDHGFELTVGVKNCRVFLPFKNVPQDKKYEIGEPLYCVVHKVETSNSATVLTVGTKLENTDNFLRQDLTLSDTIPGTCVQFTVEQISSHGVKGRFLDNCFGYIDETQMSLEVNLKKLKEGSTVPAYVLFTEPITKVTYLTMRGLDKLQGPQFEMGKILTAKVVSSAPGGLYLQLGKTGIGFVTNKRLLNTLPKDGKLDLIQAVRNKYPVGCHNECRILDYNYMQQLYICTFEKQVLKEKVFNIKDLQVGKVAKVTVEKIIPGGLCVKAGNVRGFVPNIHMSNGEYNETVKTKFSPGMKVEARVLNIPPGKNVVFTLKQDLIKCKTCLSSEDKEHINTQHVGVVTVTKKGGALIEFFGDVKGWLTSNHLNSGNKGQLIDPRKYFFIGQTVSVWIVGFSDTRLRLSLNDPKAVKVQKIHAGECFAGTVLEITSDGVKVETQPKNMESFIPVAHLCSSSELGHTLLGLYQPGNKIKNLMCVKNSDTLPVLSRREWLAFNQNSMKIFKFHELRKNTVLRCSFEEENELGILVSTPIRDYNENIFIPRENIAVKKRVQVTFEKHQCVLCQILKVDHQAKKIGLSLLFESSLSGGFKNVEDSFDQLLEDIEYATKVFIYNNKEYSKWKMRYIGKPTTCTIQSIDANGDHSVTLTNGAKGVIRKHLTQPGSKVGQEIRAVVLETNLSEQCMELCSKRDLFQKINKVQDGSLEKSFGSPCSARLLLVTPFYMIGVLIEKDCNRQLVYLPLELNKKPKSYTKKMKIIISRKIGNKIIGVSRKNQTREKQTKIPKINQNETEETVDTSSEDEDIVESVEVSDEEDQISADEDQEDTTSPPPSPTKENNHQFITQNNELKIESVLPGAQSFYISKDEASIKDDSSSSDDDEEETMHSKKKLKMTPQERAEAAKKEEERISEIEKQLADIPTIPQTAEQFDRQLLANPNSSELWLQYMSMHVAAAELDKARAVGKRAVETVNMTLIKEKFNIWVALLNLENMYGTKESFEKVFEDAVRYNDSLEIYLSVINMFASSGKLVEMEEKIKKLRAKEKHNSKMWLEIGRIYYSLQKFKEARDIKDAAIKSILEKKRQFDIILRFGIMEFQLGDLEQAIAYFETILNAYPSKVNIWIIYVDQLVKRKNIECARKILDRAISQKFGAKTMKILFQKYVNFEKQYGTEETVDKVKDLAKAYVTSL